MQFLLDARWFNFSREERNKVSDEIEATDMVKVYPSRLGVYVEYSTDSYSEKELKRIFILLTDTRIMKLNCFIL